MKLLKSNESSYTSTALLRTKSSSEFHGGGGGGEGRELPMTGKEGSVSRNFQTTTLSV